MEVVLIGTTQILSQTPLTLKHLLGELSDKWTDSANDRDDWAPYDVVGHLIHCEKTDWIPRAEVILAQGESRTFVPFDRWAQFENSKCKERDDLLTDFARLRTSSLDRLLSWNLSEHELGLKGKHPELGEVTLGQLLSTWTVHDLGHIRQIVTYMARK